MQCGCTYFGGLAASLIWSPPESMCERLLSASRAREEAWRGMRILFSDTIWPIWKSVSRMLSTVIDLELMSEYLPLTDSFLISRALLDHTDLTFWPLPPLVCASTPPLSLLKALSRTQLKS